jgi:light-regulated signal transduction histidine kinase (bacteriophytochrome)
MSAAMSMQQIDPAHADGECQLPAITGAVAHKLKQPLSVAWGYTELLLEAPNCELDATTLHCLREIDASLRRMDEVINRLQHTPLHAAPESPDQARIVDLGVVPS